MVDNKMDGTEISDTEDESIRDPQSSAPNDMRLYLPTYELRESKIVKSVIVIEPDTGNELEPMHKMWYLCELGAAVHCDSIMVKKGKGPGVPISPSCHGRIIRYLLSKTSWYGSLVILLGFILALVLKSLEDKECS